MIDSNQDEAVKLEALDSCQRVQMAKGGAYPRSCQICGLGPCPYSARTTPANLNAPDKQEALAGEAVEAMIERLRSTYPVYNGLGTFRDHIRNPDGAAAADMLERLSRTPSSPQADEADVERLRHLSEIRHLVDAIEGESIPHCRRRYIVRIREALAAIATRTTRPAGGEEVGWTIEHGPVEGSVYLTASMGWSKHRASAIRFARKVDADDMIEANGWEDFRVAALTKPAALPKGEDLDQLILDARVAASGTRLTCREREVIRALCDAVEARAALAPPPQAQGQTEESQHG